MSSYKQCRKKLQKEHLQRTNQAQAKKDSSRFKLIIFSCCAVILLATGAIIYYK